MKILIISHQLTYSGACIALIGLAESLIKQGHTVSICSIADGKLRTEFEKLGIKIFNPSFSKLFFKYIALTHNPIFSKKIKWYLRKQFRPHLEEDYDLYFANTYGTINLALNLCDNSDKIFAWIHEARNYYKPRGIKENLIGFRYIKHAFFAAKFTIHEYSDLLINCKIQQMPYLITMNDLEINPKYKNYFAVVGLWEIRKNQDWLIKTIDENQINIKINFIGAKKPPTIKNPNYNFFERIPLQQSKNLIASSFGLISASLSEVQPLSVIESILAGNPVLLSNISAHRELKEIFPNIPLFEFEDPKSFLDGLKIIADQKNNSSLINKNKIVAEKFFGRLAFEQKLSSFLENFDSRSK